MVKFKRSLPIIMLGLFLFAQLAAGASNPSETALRYLQNLIAGDFQAAQAMHNAQMQGAIDANGLQVAWEGLLKQAGPLRDVGQPFVESQNAYTLVYVPCTFDTGVLDVLVVIDAEGLIAGLNFVPHELRASWQVPDYADPELFNEATIKFGLPEWELNGTFTTPRTAGKYPVIVLVHGSGPQDQDATVGANKIFKDIAWGLASRGVGVFRYDKRTVTHGARMNAQTVTVEEEVIADAVAAVERVYGFPNVSSVFVLGHSLGGTLAPEIAARTTYAHGMIIMAGTPRPLSELIVEQVSYLSGLDGVVTPDEQAIIDGLTVQTAALNKRTLPMNETIMGAPAAYWYDLLDRNPIEALQESGKPALFLQGERDYQVTMTDWQLWRDAFEGDVGPYIFKSYPLLNHLFLAGSGPANPQEYEIPGHVDVQLIDDIAQWIMSQR